MRKLFAATFAIVLVTTLVPGSLWAESGWDFHLNQARVIGNTHIVLEPGSYELRLNGSNEAEIYRNKKLIATVAVEVRPLEVNEDAKSILTRSGNIIEIRMKKEVVVFPGTTRS